MQMLKIKIVGSPAEAPHYRRDVCDMRATKLTETVIVCKGTESGRPTVDLVFEDEQGGQYVALVTGALIEQLAGAVRGAAQRRT